MTYTEIDVQRLGARLDAIELADGERNALEALLAFAARKPSELEALTDPTSGRRYVQVLPDILFETYVS